MAKTVVHSTADEKRPVNLIVPVKESGETVNERKTYYDLAGQDLASWSGYASNMNNILAEAHRLAQATKSFLRLKSRRISMIAMAVVYQDLWARTIDGMACIKYGCRLAALYHWTLAEAWLMV
jgi:hypothetical protein